MFIHPIIGRKGRNIRGRLLSNVLYSLGDENGIEDEKEREGSEGKGLDVWG